MDHLVKSMVLSGRIFRNGMVMIRKNPSRCKIKGGVTMLDYEYIEIEKALIPYRFEMELGAELFLIEIRYNELHDYFSLDLQKMVKYWCVEKSLFMLHLYLVRCLMAVFQHLKLSL